MKKRPRCERCGYTATKHCGFDEPGLDHEESCDKMHHEFKPKKSPAESAKRDRGDSHSRGV